LIKAGRLRFFNDARFNELSGGLGTAMTATYAAHNPFNYLVASYVPVEGRLVIFPAKLPHDVEPNASDGDRGSLSDDLILTSREERGPGLYEFRAPSPVRWRRARRVEDV
jgi:hypothetical protein